jgi:phage shock protein PspC (stress-responsive transcriptional regulator)
MPQRLTRDTKNALLGGVAAGMGEYFGVDPVLVRLVFVLLAFMSGIGVLAYVVCWVIMPRKDEPDTAPAGPGGASDAAPASTPADRVTEGLKQAGERVAAELRKVAPGERRSRVIAGVILIVLGAVFLLDRMWWWHWPAWMRLGNLWPVILMALGASILWQAARGKRT